MTLTLIGINHKTAPIELRERIAISREELPEATRALSAMPGVVECMIVSTCNRVEILASVEGEGVDLAGFLHHHFALDPALLAPHIYRHSDQEAVLHLFRVAASLDSMVVGEPQILGQVKEAFAVAKTSGTIGSQLEHLLQSAFAAAKRVRTQTEIGSSSVSIASVAVELAQQIFGSLHGRTVFLVGAGKMSELAARHPDHVGRRPQCAGEAHFHEGRPEGCEAEQSEEDRPHGISTRPRDRLPTTFRRAVFHRTK